MNVICESIKRIDHFINFFDRECFVSMETNSVSWFGLLAEDSSENRFGEDRLANHFALKFLNKFQNLYYRVVCSKLLNHSA